MVLPTEGWVLLHQSLIKKMPPGLSTVSDYEGISSVKALSSQITLACVKLPSTVLTLHVLAQSTCKVNK